MKITRMYILSLIYSLWMPVAKRGKKACIVPLGKRAVFRGSAILWAIWSHLCILVRCFYIPAEWRQEGDPVFNLLPVERNKLSAGMWRQCCLHPFWTREWVFYEHRTGSGGRYQADKDFSPRVVSMPIPGSSPPPHSHTRINPHDTSVRKAQRNGKWEVTV